MDGVMNLVPQMPKRDVENFVCPTCGGSFFEEVCAVQVPLIHNVAPGQKIPTKGAHFFLLRCLRCSELIEPHIQIGPRDHVRKEYEKFWDELEAKQKAGTGETL